MEFIPSLHILNRWILHTGLLCWTLMRPTFGTESDTICLFTQYGTSYRGTESRTNTGKSCQFWNHQIPHSHPYTTASLFPDTNLEEAGNSCRNPGGSRDRPWCYTTDVTTEWEYCDIRACECTVSTDGHGYRGRASTTVTGKPCQRWDQQAPHKHVHTYPRAFPEGNLADANSYCRNPDGEWKGSPWCFTTDPDTRWEICDIPKCECKDTNRGGTYQGEISKTKTGKTCQKWSEQVPHPHNFQEGSMYSDGSVERAKNYCRNPDSSASSGPWCLTTDPQVRWEYCAIPKCEHVEPVGATARPIYTTPYPGLTPPVRTARQEKDTAIQECKFDKAGTAYMGLVSNAFSDTVCQRWDTQTPRQHAYTNPELFPDATLSDAGNQCRNPGNRALGPWCYTSSGSVEWEYCDIPICHCKTSRKGEDYLGNIHVTKSGKACQRWLDQSPHQHSYTVSMFPDTTLQDIRNFCRNPDGEHPDGPWCLTLDPDTRWEYCSVPFCECSSDKSGQQYAGTVSTTVSGLTCQRWDDDSVHSQNYKDDDSAFIDGSVRAAENYCRNPDVVESKGPWCYTTDPNTRWEYCSVPLCAISSNSASTEELEKAKKPESKDCREGDGRSYIGMTSLTVSGHQCQPWALQSPNRHDFTNPDHFPDASLEEVKNYCRNPLEGIDTAGPWCYTTTQGVRWESCGIPSCTGSTSKPMLERIPYECLRSGKGSLYEGRVNRTVSGRQCQSWLSQTPHPHSVISIDGSMKLEEAGNSCRNPGGGRDRPWCYTTDVNTEWEYCDIPACGCKTETHGRNFTGPISRTASGKPCQSWSAQKPHPHSYTINNYFPDGSVAAAGSFCRNPAEDEPWGPWCYTTDPDTRWEYCDVPACECRTTVMGQEYHGSVSTTSEGVLCQSWLEQSPHQHTLPDPGNLPDRSIAEAANHCRNPVGLEADRPWCYTTDPDTRWGFCDIPFCEGIKLRDPSPLPAPKACLESVSGQEYRGTVSVSRRGKKCQRWTSQIPHQHRYNTRHFFPDRSLEESSNFCRNPDDTGGTVGVWCYTTDLNVRWDFCDVPYCSGVVHTTTLGIKILTTTPEPATSTLSSQYTGRPEETLAKGDSELGGGGIAAVVLGILLFMLFGAIALFSYKHRRIIAKIIKAERYQPQMDPSRDVGLTFYNNNEEHTDVKSCTKLRLDWPKPEVPQEVILKMRPNETLENPTEAASIDDHPPVTVL